MLRLGQTNLVPPVLELSDEKASVARASSVATTTAVPVCGVSVSVAFGIDIFVKQ